MHVPALPTDTSVRPLRERLNSCDISPIVLDFYTFGRTPHEVIARFNITLTELEEILSWPEAAEEVARLRRLAALRASAALDLILPAAIDRLVETMQDESAPTETRRKAAGSLIRLQRQHARAASPESQPRRSEPDAPDSGDPAQPARAPRNNQQSTHAVPAMIPTASDCATGDAPIHTAPARASPNRSAA